MNNKFTALMILDGFGFRKESDGNAVKLAKTPNIDALMAEYPHTSDVAAIDRAICAKWSEL